MVPNALSFHRTGGRLRRWGLSRLARAFERTGRHLHRTHLDPGARLGPQVELGYGGIGVTIAPGVEIGPRSFLSQDVTVGELAPGAGVPKLGADVFVGAGAKILGAVRIGDGAKIGANAVVIDDVPPGATVAGVPARALRGGRSPAR